jgi:hypothetical protein
MPYPEFTAGVFNSSSSGVIQQATNAGSSYFHQLQVRLEKRLAQGLQFVTNYSYSKLMQRASYLLLIRLTQHTPTGSVGACPGRHSRKPCGSSRASSRQRKLAERI